MEFCICSICCLAFVSPKIRELAAMEERNVNNYGSFEFFEGGCYGIVGSAIPCLWDYRRSPPSFESYFNPLRVVGRNA